MTSQITQDHLNNIAQAMNSAEFTNKQLDDCLETLRPILDEDDLSGLTDDQIRLCMAQSMSLTAVLMNIKDGFTQPEMLQTLMTSVGFLGDEDAPGASNIKAVALDSALDASIKDEAGRSSNDIERLNRLRKQTAEVLCALGHAKSYFEKQTKAE